MLKGGLGSDDVPTLKWNSAVFQHRSIPGRLADTYSGILIWILRPSAFTWQF